MSRAPLILLPWAAAAPIHPDLTALLARERWTRVMPVKCRGDDGYWWFLHYAWKLALRDHDDLVVIEHDIIPHRGTIRELLACEQDYCGFMHSIGTQYKACLGCTKFGRRFIRAFPDFLHNVGLRRDGGLPARHWKQLDGRIEAEARDHDYVVHSHLPPVYHANTDAFIKVELERGWCVWPATVP